MSLRVSNPGTTQTEVDDDWSEVSEETPPTQIYRFTLRTSAAFCPFPDMVRWLEALVCGVQRCAWWWNAEGWDHGMEWTGNQLLLLRDDDELMRVKLRRADIVRAFYLSLRRFAMSARYKLDEWEERYQIEVISERDGRGLTPEELRGLLVVRDAAAAERFFAPTRMCLIPRLGQECPDGFRETTYEEFGGAADERLFVLRSVGPEWDEWSIARRRQHIDALFSSSASSYGGTRLRELRSRLVEAALEDESKFDLTR
jgi:hypothetical protein